MSHPLSTYRLQFHAGFRFADATAIVPYLKSLGISHVYASPYLKARSGSTHGYDVIDHNALNPEIGTEAEFDAFLAALKSHGLSHLLDIVPNHAGVATNENFWWNDVLENGPASRFANYFDIAWNASPRLESRGKLLLPVLGEPYGKVLEAGQLQIKFDRGGFFVHYYDRRFPLSLDSYRDILGPELAGRVSANQFKANLATLVENEPDIRSKINAKLAGLNGAAGDSASFDALDQLLTRQHYRLACWRVAPDEINYRRFFDINDLAALSMARQEVFEATHALVLDLIAKGKLDGLRVDHPDGLYDPRQYFQRLAAASPVSNLYVVVEKILGSGEPLPADWPVSGTTGYDFLALANGLFVDSSAKEAFTRIYQDFTADRTSYADLVYRNKSLMLDRSFSSELHMLAIRLDHLAQRDRNARDFTLTALREALAQVIACFPVYRSYVTAEGVHDSDARSIDQAVQQAIKRNPNISEAIFGFIRDMLLQRHPRGFTEDDRAAQLRFAGKFQQLTAPVTAKGIEDTTFYTYNRLISLNEVGGDPDHFGTAPEALHAYLKDRQQHWPGGLSPLSTHDTKRSEDVRARMNVLSEMPAEWERAVMRWRETNAGHRGEVHPNDEYLLYQTLVGVWPLDEAEMREFEPRIQAYMRKALREGKVRTTWTSPNEEYEQAVAAFISRILDVKTGEEFLKEFVPFQKKVSAIGLYNSVSQTLLRLTAPGVPDTYQGSELWDFSLVDPDNRRPVDFVRREKMLTELQARSSDKAGLLREFLPSMEDGRIKMFVNRIVLGLRQQEPELFSKGEYVPLRVAGRRANHVFAFARRYEGKELVVIVPRLFAALMRDSENAPVGNVWGHTTITAEESNPSRSYRNVFTSALIRPDQTIRLEEMLATFPWGVFLVG